MFVNSFEMAKNAAEVVGEKKFSEVIVVNSTIVDSSVGSKTLKDVLVDVGDELPIIREDLTVKEYTWFNEAVTKIINQYLSLIHVFVRPDGEGGVTQTRPSISNYGEDRKLLLQELDDTDAPDNIAEAVYRISDLFNTIMVRGDDEHDDLIAFAKGNAAKLFEDGVLPEGKEVLVVPQYLEVVRAGGYPLKSAELEKGYTTAVVGSYATTLKGIISKFKGQRLLLFWHTDTYLVGINTDDDMSIRKLEMNDII